MASGTVLIADDDSAIRTVLTQALTRAGFTVRATGMASALWRWVSEGEGDVVVTDVVLPDENAFDVLPRIRKMRPMLPVIVMSAQNTIMTAIRSAELGAYDYLPKPFDLSGTWCRPWHGRWNSLPRRQGRHPRCRANPCRSSVALRRCRISTA
jgi:two-component system nitrogen regulation response regulator GlnG